MGRRSSKSSPVAGAALPFDTVGMTILPGTSLPEWAEPRTQAAELAGPELIADAPVPPPAQAVGQAAAQAQPQEWGAPAATQGTPAQQAARSPEPVYAMAGAPLVGAAAVGGPAGYGPSDHVSPAETSRYPAAPTAGPPAMSAPPAAPIHAPAPPSGVAPAYGQNWAAAPPAAPAGVGDPGPPLTSYGAAGQPAPAGGQTHGAGGAATAYATEADTRTFAEAAGPLGATQATLAEASGPAAPSTEWRSPERPELSPEHVALLSWWADMIAAGQFPAPAGTASPGATAAEKPDRRSFPLKAAAVSLVAIAAVGTAAVFGPKILADEPAVVPATEVSTPATVGGLVTITDPAVSTELETLLGFGLRPAGVTVTNAYGPTSVGPLALAAMATIMGPPAEAVGQVATWAARTGATVAPSVAGTGANEGITCAAVEAIPEAQPGSFCVWSAGGKRGQTYAVAMSVEDAQTLTNQLRTSITGA